MPAPFPMVLLRHEVPDGTAHYDWLIDLAGSGGDDETTLLSFRVDAPLAARRNGFAAIRLPDHRRLYLRHEGELGRDRGRVQRIDAGTAWTTVHPEDRVRIVGAFADGAVRVWWGVRVGKMWWIQSVLDRPPAPRG